MVDNTGRESSADDTENVREVVLNPNYPRLLRWYVRAISAGNYETPENIRKALYSVIDITRYLAFVDIQELQSIMDELKEERGMRVGAIITADGTFSGRLMDDDSIEVDNCDHSDSRVCQALGHAVGPSNEPS